MRTLLGSCTLLFVASASLFAQSANTSSALMLQQPISQNCPVSLRADRVPGGVLARAADAKHSDGKPLHISFKPIDDHGVTQADLVLHGTSGTHIAPAGSHADSTSTEAFSVSPSRANYHLFDSVIYFRKLTAVSYLELKSITFADGTVWHASATSTCRVAPDGYMLVTAMK